MSTFDTSDEDYAAFLDKLGGEEPMRVSSLLRFCGGSFETVEGKRALMLWLRGRSFGDIVGVPIKLADDLYEVRYRTRREDDVLDSGFHLVNEFHAAWLAIEDRDRAEMDEEMAKLTPEDWAALEAEAEATYQEVMGLDTEDPSK